MKLTTKLLKRIIREEYSRLKRRELIKEAYDPSDDIAQEVRRTLEFKDNYAKIYYRFHNVQDSAGAVVKMDDVDGRKKQIATRALEELTKYLNTLSPANDNEKGLDKKIRFVVGKAVKILKSV